MRHKKKSNKFDVFDVQATEVVLPTPENTVSIEGVDEESTIYDENPFLDELVKNLSKKKKQLTVGSGSDIVLIDHDAGNEVVGKTRFYQEVEVDQASYVKLFAEHMKDMFRLQPAGMQVFMFFLYLTKDAKQIRKDHVRASWEMCQNLMKQLGTSMSRATFYRGKNDLIAKRFIAPANIAGESKNWYFINPNVFWNGDRLEVAKVYIESKRNKVHAMRLQQDPAAFKDLDTVPTEELDFSGRDKESF